MFLAHLLLGFIISYAGYVPPSMLNITVSKIRVKNNKKSAYQFISGVSLVVFFQFVIAVLIVSSLKEIPQLIMWIQSVAIIVFLIVSVFFLKKGLSKKEEKQNLTQNIFLLGVSLSTINMFAIPFFTISYSFLVLKGFVNTDLNCVITFAIGIFLGVIAVLSSYVFLAEKLKNKITIYANFLNVLIGMVTGFLAVYTSIKLYF